TPAEALMRASMVVDPTVPPLGESVSDVTKVLPLGDSSTPAGAVTVMGPVRLLPLTVKNCPVPGAPAVVVPRFSDVGLTAIAGVGVGLTNCVTVLLVLPRKLLLPL